MLSVSNFFVEHLLGRRGAFHSIGLEVQGQLCRSQFSPSIMWILEMKLTFLGLAASAFPTEASCEPVSQLLYGVLTSLLSTAWDDQRIEDFPSQMLPFMAALLEYSPARRSPMSMWF